MFVVHCGDNLPILREMADNSVDAIVTDPPYGLSFMGKRWDYDVPSVELWAECLRVLKPGGHLLAFAGTRTQHRMAVRIEDAGFEIRDMIAWVYGSGFPKSLDVSKAIDKSHGENRDRQLRFVQWMRSTGITAKDIDAATNSQMSRHFLPLDQPAIATADMFDKLRPYLPEVPEEIERLVCERTGLEWTAYKNREVVGHKIVNGEEGTAGGYQNGIASVRGSDVTSKREVNITAPATDAAKQWDGWGSALKPALEPITLARKPLAERTIAANVLEWGTGGVNVDGCRIATDELTPRNNKLGPNGWKNSSGGLAVPSERGRFPANFIHDGSDEVVRLFPVTTSGDLKGQPRVENKIYGSASKTLGKPRYWNGDTGSAARFFYCAKASRSERNAGLEGIEARQKVFNGQSEESAGMAPGSVEDKFTTTPSANFHPTIKPIALMRYLCRLVTPPGGIVLDPFTGSGTTGCAATLEGFGFIGIEREAGYVEIARQRIEHWKASLGNVETENDNQGQLFEEVE